MNKLSNAAQENVEECGVDVDLDVARVRGGLSREELLDECLSDCDEDRVDGWNEYVDSVFESVGDVSSSQIDSHLVIWKRAGRFMASIPGDASQSDYRLISGWEFVDVGERGEQVFADPVL